MQMYKILIELLIIKKYVLETLFSFFIYKKRIEYYRNQK